MPIHEKQIAELEVFSPKPIAKRGATDTGFKVGNVRQLIDSHLNVIRHMATNLFSLFSLSPRKINGNNCEINLHYDFFYRMNITSDNHGTIEKLGSHAKKSMKYYMT